MTPNSIITTIFIRLTTTINSVFGWFNTLMNSTGAWRFIFGAIAAMLVVRFLLYPFLKEGVARGSDKVKKGRDKDKDE